MWYQFYRSVIYRLFVVVSLAIVAVPAHAVTVMVLGDSLSASYGIAREQGWVNLLSKQLAASHPDVAIVNASISGETSGGALARLPALLERHQPDVMVIELGGNDGLRGYPIKTLRSNLAELVTLSRQSGAEVLLVGMQIPPNYGKRYTDAFYASYTELAQEQQLPLVPFLLAGIATEPALMQADGIHPTAQAQPRLLENIKPYLLPLLESVQP